MLDFKKSRIDYGEQLKPPAGYKLEYAVATTYSLDMLALLQIPVALFYSKNLDGKASENRMDILDSIQKTSDNVKIYCQKAKIKRPENNMLISFIEDSVSEIMPDKANVSFHPKIWVIRYKGEDKTLLYRVIVMSRNLTYDRSWDIAYYLEGFTGSKIYKDNIPIADYLKYLSKISDFKDSGKFIKDLLKVKFKTEKPFDKHSFHPMGFGNYGNPLWKEKFEDLIIISPFLDRTALKYFSDEKSVTGKKYLFSRKEELDKIHMETLEDYNVYAMSQRVVDGEDDIVLSEEADEESMNQNLHAKIFIGSRKENKTRWYLGSANSTNAAMSRNDEFLISLDSGEKQASVKEILKILTPKPENGELEIFEKYVRKIRDPIESEEFDFRKITFSVLNFLENSKNINARCTPDKKQEDKFDISIKFASDKLFKTNGFKFYCAPYGWKRDLKLIKDKTSLIFESMSLQNLSPFLIWKIHHIKTDTDCEFMTRIPIMLPDNRKQSIFRSIIQNREKFFEFIQFLLGNSDGQFEFNGRTENDKNSFGGSKGIFNHKQPLFEDLLKASSRDRGKLRVIDKVIQQLQYTDEDKMIPEDFKIFWKVFQEVLKIDA
jgi:hypothetical protein